MHLMSISGRTGDNGGGGSGDGNKLGKLISTISIPVGTMQTGFETANVLKAGLKDIAIGAKVLGKASDILAVASIGHDFATGTANTSTLLNGFVLVGGAVAIGVIGVAAAPWVAGFGVVYGIGSLIFEKPLNNAFDMSGSINFIKPSN